MNDTRHQKSLNPKYKYTFATSKDLITRQTDLVLAHHN